MDSISSRSLWTSCTFLSGVLVMFFITSFTQTKTAPESTSSEVKTHNRQVIQPDVAWIMSFGGSGTSYTMVTVEEMSGRTTASNYARGFDGLVPVKPEWNDGPFLRSPSKQLPINFILCKTHCMGYCMDCKVESSYNDFDEHCRTAQIPGGLTTVYSRDIPKRAIHLIRDPFDNLIGRMHLYNKLNKKRRHDDSFVPFNTTSEGLTQWCSYLDGKYPIESFAEVPCAVEFYKYISWHNSASQTIQQYEIPVRHIYYEDYGKLSTLKHVCEFLELDCSVNDPIPFKVGHSYRDLFSNEAVLSAMRMIKELSQPSVYTLFERYVVH